MTHWQDNWWVIYTPPGTSEPPLINLWFPLLNTKWFKNGQGTITPGQLVVSLPLDWIDGSLIKPLDNSSPINNFHGPKHWKWIVLQRQQQQTKRVDGEGIWGYREMMDGRCRWWLINRMVSFWGMSPPRVWLGNKKELSQWWPIIKMNGAKFMNGLRIYYFCGWSTGFCFTQANLRSREIM